MTPDVSRSEAQHAASAFRVIRTAKLKAVAAEAQTLRQAMDAMRRAYERLRAAYLRVPGTTYQGWLEQGPHAEWEEVLAARKDEAVWDRLVDRESQR